MNKQLNVLYTCDDAFLDLTSISIASVIENNKDSYICFYIATEKKNSENYKKLVDFYKYNEKIKFRYLDCTKYDEVLEQKKFDRWGSNSYYVYWKLFAYDFIDEDEIWYLDSDVICLKEIDYPGIKKTVGAVLDCAHADFNMRAHINENYFFFNTGSMYVNIKRWKENRCVEKIVEYIKNIEHMPLMCDQDILAVALQEDIEVINPKYNYLVGYDYYGVNNVFEMYSLSKKPFYKEKEIVDAKDNVVFYHCLGGVFGRPWQKNNFSPIKEDFNKYTKLSVWSDYEGDFKPSIIFKLEKKLEILPKPIYNKIHNLAQKMYLRLILF